MCVAKAVAYFESIARSTIEIASLLSVNQFSPPNAEVRTPKYGDSLFPNRDTYYDGFFVNLEPGQAVRMSGRLPDRWRYVSFVFYDRWYGPSIIRRCAAISPEGFAVQPGWDVHDLPIR